jgi:hypothetical protein
VPRQTIAIEITDETEKAIKNAGFASAEAYVEHHLKADGFVFVDGAWTKPEPTNEEVKGKGIPKIPAGDDTRSSVRSAPTNKG